ncbi:MAG: helix-turn-helix domain-containing protein [Verrucomicrobiota bacterium]
MDLKSRAIKLLEEGSSAAKVAERLLVSKRSVERIRKHWTENGELPVSRRKGKSEKLLVGQEDSLRERIEKRPEITLKELAERLLESKEIKASEPTIWRKLQALGLRHKKNGFRG